MFTVSAPYLYYHTRTHRICRYLSHLWTKFHLQPRHSSRFVTFSTELLTERLVCRQMVMANLSAEAPAVLSGSPAVTAVSLSAHCHLLPSYSTPSIVAHSITDSSQSDVLAGSYIEQEHLTSFTVIQDWQNLTI
jgi:hypothetical protein